MGERIEPLTDAEKENLPTWIGDRGLCERVLEINRAFSKPVGEEPISTYGQFVLVKLNNNEGTVGFRYGSEGVDVTWPRHNRDGVTYKVETCLRPDECRMLASIFREMADLAELRR